MDRAALGPIVFSDTVSLIQILPKHCLFLSHHMQAKLQRLNEIVWPQILKLADEKISQAHNRGSDCNHVFKC